MRVYKVLEFLKRMEGHTISSNMIKYMHSYYPLQLRSHLHLKQLNPIEFKHKKAKLEPLYARDFQKKDQRLSAW